MNALILITDPRRRRPRHLRVAWRRDRRRAQRFAWVLCTLVNWSPVRRRRPEHPRDCPPSGACPWATCHWHAAHYRKHARTGGPAYQPHEVPDLTTWAETCLRRLYEPGESASLRTIAPVLDITPEGVRKIEQAALLRLRASGALADWAPPGLTAHRVGQAIGETTVERITQLMSGEPDRWFSAMEIALQVDRAQVTVWAALRNDLADCVERHDHRFRWCP